MALPLLLVLLTLATARLTRVVTADTLTASLRMRWWRRFPPDTRGQYGHPLGQLIDCQWCVSWWAAGALVAATAQVVSTPAPLLWWPAVAHAASLLAAWADRG